MDYNKGIEIVRNHLLDSAEVISRSAQLSEDIYSIALKAVDVIRNGNTILWCGNGGSAADSQHMSAELVGKYKFNRKPISSISLTTDTSILTAISNDFDFTEVFRRQIDAIGRQGDLLIALSTSGSSQSVLNAIKAAKEKNIFSILLTSRTCITSPADITLRVPSEETPLIQHAHTAIGHVICEIIENSLLEKLG